MKTSNLLFLALLFFAGCNYSDGKRALDIEPDIMQKITSPEQLTYKMVSESVLNNFCLRCHSVAGGNKGGINLENYDNVFKNAHQIRLELAGGTMPPNGKLSDDQIKLFTDWIDAGATEHGKASGADPAPQPPAKNLPPPKPKPIPEPIPEPPIQKITSELVFNQVIKTNCLKCHSNSGGNKGEINLETYDNIFEKRLDIKFQVESNQMPTQRGIPLTAEQKKLILTWIEQGSLK